MENPQIYKALCAIQKEIGVIGKDKKNQQQGFMFRGIDQVMNTLHPILAEFGVVVIPEIISTKRNKAMAVAYKYACFQVFCIPTEEMAKADPDNYTVEASKPSDAQLKTYIDNCETVEDFKTMKANWGVYIGGNAELSSYANARYAEIKKGGAV